MVFTRLHADWARVCCTWANRRYALPLARALTRRRRGSWGGPTSHPRLRGLLLKDSRPSRNRPESLPLALAPPDHCRRVRAGVGFTPARAGCAETCGVVRSARSDHSCSRRLHGAGVASGLHLRDHYSPACAVPPALNTAGPENRVAPARAGATSTSAGTSCGVSSQPRSRGHTTDRARASQKLQGSHPRSRRLFPITAAACAVEPESLLLTRAITEAAAESTLLHESPPLAWETAVRRRHGSVRQRSSPTCVRSR
jgi:hypothetical protein